MTDYHDFVLQVSIQYVADETGFHATGSHVPQVETKVTKHSLLGLFWLPCQATNVASLVLSTCVVLFCVGGFILVIFLVQLVL